MNSPTAEDRAFLLKALKEMWFDSSFEKTRTKKSKAPVRKQIIKTIHFLNVDEDACKIGVTPRMAKNASIMRLCRTLRALKISKIKKKKLCKCLRKLVKSNEPCACPPSKSKKENFAETNQNHTENNQIKA